MLNPELHKSKKIRDLYKENNLETVEKSVYDQASRSWIMKKVFIDPNAANMSKVIKTEKQAREKKKVPKLRKVPVKPRKPNKERVISEIDSVKLYEDYKNEASAVELSKKYNVVLAVVNAVIKRKYKLENPNIKKEKQLRSNTVPAELIEKLYSEYTSGSSASYLSEKYLITHRAIHASIREQSIIKGDVKPSKSDETAGLVMKLYKKGLSQTKIASILGKGDNTICYHIKNLRNKKLIK